MENEKLIEQLRDKGCEDCPHRDTCRDDDTAECVIRLNAATALSTLQDENSRLRAELEYEQEHANAYYEECGQWEAENEKLRAELENYRKGHCSEGGCAAGSAGR